MESAPAIVQEKKNNIVQLELVQKNENNKKKKKKKNKFKKLLLSSLLQHGDVEKKNGSSIVYNGLVLGCVMIMIFISYILFVPPDQPFVVQEKYRLVKRGSNTTSLDYVFNEKSESPREFQTLLNDHHHNHPVICLHHLDYIGRYKVCMLERKYLMINPTILPNINGYMIDVIEQSISCSSDASKKRFQCIEMKWSDGKHDLRGRFCGDAAIGLQMMMDEFEGNKHCV